MRLTVLGCGPAAPQPDTPASGLLVENGATAVLLDCGQGVASRVVRLIEPDRLTAVIIGHMHADHFIDLSALRYQFDWGGRTQARLPVLLPPGGLARLAELAAVVSERPGFFDDAFDVREYDPGAVDRIGELDVAYVPGRHYVPAWGTVLSAPDGTRIVYAGDTGPNPELAGVAAGADLMICEATLGSVAEDDVAARGHLTLDEAVEHGRAANAARLLITHYPSARREAMNARLAGLDGRVGLARPGLAIEVGVNEGHRDVEAAGGPASSTDPIPFAARRAAGDR
jgi:ribonuclease BN (tRNA processing enzyme)